jgi:hypothetical protein
MQPSNPHGTPQTYGSNPGAPFIGHETSDVNVKAILGFLIALTVSGLLVFAICYGIYGAFNRYVDNHDPQPATWTANQERREAQQVEQLAHEGANTTQIEQGQFESRVERFPQPRLQTDDVRDMQALREEEDLQLDHYMWKDQAQGQVIVPIDRAIDLVAERGLPTVPNAQPVNIQEPYTVGITRVGIASSH